MYELLQACQKLNYSTIRRLLLVVNRMIEREERQMNKEGCTEAEINQVRQDAYQEIKAFIEKFEINEER